MKGKKVFSLQTLPCSEKQSKVMATVAKANGFSLHAGIAVKKHQGKKLETVCRYITRPPLAISHLSLTSKGNVRYGLKKPYQDGTTHVVFEPLDFISKLAALVPVPRINLTRFHGVFAPNSQWRQQVVKMPAKPSVTEETVAQKRRAMTWAQRLKRAFGIDICICVHCGGRVRIISCIEDPIVIENILSCVADKKLKNLSPV